MATIKQVSSRAGVSVATVSRVLNGNQHVEPETRARVVDAMNALGYQPNSSARALATNRTESIGLVLGNLGGPFFGDLMEQAEHEARASNRSVLITSGGTDKATELAAINGLLRRQVDGLILHVDHLTEPELESICHRNKTPIVVVNRLLPGARDRCIYVDNHEGGRIATNHLLNAGHLRIACITGPQFKTDSRDRLAGYQRALSDAGLPAPGDYVIEADYTEPGGRAAALQLLERGTGFTGLFCGNDLMAFGAIRALKDAGIRVPDDVAVVGYDDIVMAAYFEPGLTTVHLPIGVMGREAMRLAVQLADNARAEVQHTLPVTLTVRASG